MFFFFFFFFNDTATTEIYTLSLHDALPIYGRPQPGHGGAEGHQLLELALLALAHRLAAIAVLPAALLVLTDGLQLRLGAARDRDVGPRRRNANPVDAGELPRRRAGEVKAALQGSLPLVAGLLEQLGLGHP